MPIEIIILPRNVFLILYQSSNGLQVLRFKGILCNFMCSPQEPKRSVWWDRKRFKMVQNQRGGGSRNDHLNAFPAVLRSRISDFFRGSMPPDLPKTLAECPTVPNYAGLSRFFLRIPNPDSTSVGTRQVSRFWRSALTSQRAEKYIYIFLNYHNICHKMNKPFNLDISRSIPSCSRVEWCKKYKIKWQTMLACSIERLSNFPAFLN